MTWTIEAIVRASIVLVAGIAVAALLRRHRAALRHAVLAGAIFGSAIVPAGRLLPAVTLHVPSLSSPIRNPAKTGIAAVPSSAERTVATAAATAHVSTWTLVWFAGFSMMAALLVLDVMRLRRVAAAAQPLHDRRWIARVDGLRTTFGITRRVPLLLTTTRDTLATSGFLRPRVLLPSDAASWSDERIAIVLSHELAHVRRADWAIQIAAEVVRAACWFNPLTWMACTRLRRESEHACDDVVVGSGIPPADYAAHLLDIARTCRQSARPGSAMTMARPSTLHRRIAVMLNRHIDHRPIAPRRMAWAAVLVFAAMVSVVAIQAKQSGPAPLSGTVYDATGAVLPGVTLVLRDANGAQQTSTSDRSGHFEFSTVAPGGYRMTISAPGFRTLDAQFELKAPQDWDRSITLQVGNLQETITVSAERFGGAPPVVPGAQPVRVGGDIRPPMKTLDVRPVYPPEMRAAGREGVVPLEAIIRPDGTVGSVRVLSADVHPDFAIAAVDAVRQWRFTPTLLNGKPVEVVMNVSISFKLAD
jgi:TonB family protein